MEPMFLDEIEAETLKHPAVDAVKKARGVIPQIWHLISYKPQATRHLMAFTQEVMRGLGLEARKLVRSGRIGGLRAIQCFFSYFNTNPENIRNQAGIGGGGLMDIGCYPITVSRYMWDAEPRRVFGLVERDPELKVDRLTSAILDFPGGHSTFTCSTQLVPYQRIHFFGTRGRLEIARAWDIGTVGLFGDVGWAGLRTNFGWDDVLYGIGVGGSVIDGLIRMDLSHGLTGPFKQFRIDLYLDALL